MAPAVRPGSLSLTRDVDTGACTVEGGQGMTTQIGILDPEISVEIAHMLTLVLLCDDDVSL